MTDEKEYPYPKNVEDPQDGVLYCVFRDGKRVMEYKYGQGPKPMTPGDHNACWRFLMDCQGMSTDWAIRYEGYTISEYIPERDGDA
jgi:hypothetical protein